VASSFTRLTQEFFAKRGQRVTVVPVSGATEIAPHLGIADIIVDLTSTGSTLKMNGLLEVGTVVESSARLIARKDHLPEAVAKLDELRQALGSVLAARGKRYLMANVLREKLPEVREVLPGLNGPTVVDVQGGEYVAVHAVVPAKTIYRTIAALKNLGCEGILVTRIERLMP
jgi:ATP phosphoribosyltransferase